VCKDPQDAVFCNNLVMEIDGEIDLNLLFEVLMGANYLDMESLLYKCCAKVATKLKGKELEDIPKILKSVTGYQTEPNPEYEEKH